MSTITQMKTRDLLDELLAERILLLDGSMGALIYSRQPQEEDYRGQRFRRHPSSLKNCTDVLNLSQPALVEDIRSGRTLAQIATARGKSVAGLEAAMVAAVKAKLDAVSGEAGLFLELLDRGALGRRFGILIADKTRRKLDAATTDVAGTIAGENTIFVAPRDGLTAGELAEQFRHHLEGDT